MERRYEVRKQELLEECEVQVEALAGVQERLKEFAQPFLAWLGRREQVDHGQTYLAGLVSNLECKNAESIAYLHDQDRRGLQDFVGESPWAHQPLLDELAIQVGQQLGEADAVLVFDPSGFPKSGRHSVGVARQWCGRLGKIDNCQVAVYLGYVARQEHALVNVRLYLPKEWAEDKQRRQKCGVPRKVRFRTRHELALEMLDEQRDLLPHGWIAGDDEMGRSTRFRRELAARKEQYLLAVPSNTTIRDLGAELLPGCRKQPFEQVRHWAERLPAEVWSRIDVRDAHLGPLLVEVAMTRVVAKTEGRRIGPEEVLVVFRVLEDPSAGKYKYDYCLSNASAETPLAEFARVAKAEHRIEECIQRGKSEAGLADYEVRTWVGWHHHQTMSLIATWFLVQETRREKKIHTSDHGPSDSDHAWENDPPRSRHRHARAHRTRRHASLAAHRASTPLPLETTEPLGSLTH